MATISPADLLALALRLLLVVLLYLLVAAVLLALRRDLAQTRRAAEAAPAPSHTYRARLTLLEAAPEDGPPGRVVPLDGELTIGRRGPCDLILRDDAVSGHHARFALRNGSWEVEDLGSTNGTFVNGRRVVRPQPLRSGDVVTTGMAAWRFQAADG
jgi:hypothetical protein